MLISTRTLVTCLMVNQGAAFIACFAFFGIKKDLGWTYQQNLARAYAEETISNLETRSFEGFGFMDDTARGVQVDKFVSEGCEMIFLCSGAFEVLANTEFAPKHPTVKFFLLGGKMWGPQANLAGSIIKVYQASYVAGIVAASEPNVTRLGYIGSTYMADSMLCINAFYRGAKSVNPNVTLALSHVGNWFMPREERIATLRMFEQQNVQIVNYDSDSTTVINVADEEGQKSICTKSDGAALVGDSVLCSQIMIWNTIIVEAIQAAMDPDPNVWLTTKNNNKFVGFEKNALSMGTYGAYVSEATRSKARKAQQDFANGIDPVFCNQHESDVYNWTCPPGAKLPQNFEGGAVTPFLVFGCSPVPFPNRCLTDDEKISLTYLFTGIEDVGLLQVKNECEAGTILDPLAAETCTNCTAGTFQDGKDQASCKQCEHGRFMAGGGATKCDLCEKGTYANTTGTHQCLPCSPGSSSENGATLCTQCELGKSQKNAGQSECLLCEGGTYAAKVGSNECLRCDDVIPGSMSQRGSKAASECMCPKGSFFLNNKSCVPCPEGLECLGGNGAPLQKAGFWADMLDPDKNIISVFKCRNKEQCPKGVVGSCASGRTKRSCNNCEPFHYPTSGGKCAKCQGHNTMMFVGFAIILLLFIVMFAVSLRINAIKQPLSTVSAGLIMGQLIFALQVLGAINQLRVQFTDPLRSIMDTMSFFSLDLEILQLPCLFYEDSPITQYALKLVSYPIFVVTLMIIWSISRLRGRPIEFSNLLNINGVILCVLFISMTLVVFLPFQCRNNPNGRLTMSTNPGLVCFDDSAHIIMAVLAICGILCYPCAIFAWISWSTLLYSSQSGSGEGMVWLRNYRFMFARFRPEAYYFGIVYLARGGLVAIISVVLVRAPAFQTMAMGVVLTLGFGLQCRFMPWRTGHANTTDLFIGFFLVLTIIGVGTILDISIEEASSVMTVLLTVVIFAIIGCAVGGIGYAFYRKFYPGDMYGIFLCHHKAGAGALCRQIKMTLKDRCRSRVFLDSDQLEDLDLIFDTVRCSTKNLVLVHSPGVLTRMWCAGEIVSAHVNNIPIIVLNLNDTPMPTTEEIEAIPKSWPDEQIATLQSFDITPEMVMDAYKHVVALPVVALNRFDHMPAKIEMLSKLAMKCKLPMKTDFASKWASQVGSHIGSPIAIAGLVSNAEALASCEIMQVMMRRKLQVDVTLVRDVSDVSVDMMPKILVVLLTGDVLSDAMFAKIIVEMLGDHGKSVPEIITVTSDTTFNFPEATFYAEVEKTSLGVPELASRGAELSATYRSLLSVIAKPFTPTGSEGLIEKQISDVSTRAQTLLDRGANGGPKKAERPGTFQYV